MSEPYHHVRFRWWEKANIDKIAKELRDNYDVDTKHHPRDKTELSLHKDDRDELIVSADTLTAHLSGFRAVMSQRSAAKFTHRDADLRERVRQIYTRDRPTPFPWSFSPETKFEVEQ
jgi:hypothetical protein